VAILELDNVEKRFGGLPAVTGVTLEVAEGEILALVGPNGAGKSTLLKAISWLQPPTRGTIRFLGRPLGGMGAHGARHRGISMVLQTPRPFATMTVRENAVVGAMFGSAVRLSEAESHRRADQALEFVGLTHRADEPVGSLNLHEQRFLDLARSLAGQPKLLLLDEVMAGLNETELAASIQIVRSAREELGVTVIWVEHVMTAVMSLADRVVVLDFGAVLAEGVPHEVMRLPDVVTAYLGEGAIAPGA